jgi:hypothetical protein
MAPDAGCHGCVVCSHAPPPPGVLHARRQPNNRLAPGMAPMAVHQGMQTFWNIHWES